MGMVTFINEFIDEDTRKLEDFLLLNKNEKVQVLGTTASFTAALQSLEVLKYIAVKANSLKAGF